MNTRLWLVAVFLIILLVSGCTGDDGTGVVTVTRVIDGDTIVVSGGVHIRYIGIDAPEVYPVSEPYGRDAWLANQALVEGKKVRLEKDVSDTDRYGRQLRYVYVGDTFVNAELVRLGYACARAYPPDIKHQDYLKEMENEAKTLSRGMWAR
jgi:micrococcal nuclease